MFPPANPGRLERADRGGVRPGVSPEPIVAGSSAMQAVLRQARAAARASGGILLCGEAGSGRRMMAYDIHRRWAGVGAPFVDVRRTDAAPFEEERLCGTSPLQSGFGDDSPPDPVTRVRSVGEPAGGTLFVADLPEMPDRLQARLAQTLHDHESCPPQAPQLRLMVSSACNWSVLVEEGRVHRDLVRRCAGTRLDIPPLRERRADIADLARIVLARLCVEEGLTAKSIDDPGLALLTALPWRGNVHELRTLLREVIRRVSGPQVRLTDLLSAVHLDGSARLECAPPTLRQARERFERDHILAALERHRGRIGETAVALAIQRPNLYRKMRALRMRPPHRGRD